MNKLSFCVSQTLAGLLAGTALISSCQSSEPAQAKTAAPSAAAQKLPVDVQVVQAQPYDASQTVVGTLMPRRQVDIASELARKVERVAFSDGATVRRGQLLYQLDAADLSARLGKAKAALRLAQLDEARFTELLKNQAARQQEYDQAFTTLQALKAEVTVLEVEAAKTAIRAPFDGRVGISQVSAGAYVAPGQVLVRLQDASQVKVRFAVPEKYVAALTVGTKVRFTTKLAAQSATAVVAATEPDVSADSRSLLVEALAPNPGGQLRAGLSANVAFPTVTGPQQAFTVPTEALVPAAEGYSVFTVRHGTAKARAVTVQNRDEYRARISAGLQAGDTVLVTNILRVMDGMPVQVMTVQPQASTL